MTLLGRRWTSRSREVTSSDVLICAGEGRGLRLVDAPVSGGVAKAADGTLIVSRSAPFVAPFRFFGFQTRRSFS